MGKKALVLLADGFEEVEVATPIDVLRRAGVEVVVAGIAGTSATGAHGLVYTADATLAAAGDGFDCIVFPGGMPGAKNLGECAAAKDLALAMAADGRVVAAICAAPVFTLGAWGLLDGKNGTCYPGMEGMFPETVRFSPDRVVVDGNLVTSRGPGTAMDFALCLAERLAGAAVAGQVAADMLVREK